MSGQPNYIPEVRKQYEEFPYPHRNPEDERKQFIITYLSRLDNVNHQCFAGKQDFANFRVLSAGGGTGDSAIAWAEQLREMPNSSVAYLDMSTASAEIAQKRAKIRKLDNITWINDSILNISDLGLEKFDFIDCTGVLHHLKDPDAGLRALVSVLKPGGAMNLMLYAPYGRTGVYQIQKLMHMINGEEENPRTKLKNTKAALASLPLHHWYNVSKKIGWTYDDAENDAGIYDLFLHDQDRPFSILETHDWLERADMKMSGEPGYMYHQTNYLPETFVKDKNLLKIINEQPLKMRQAIGEAMANKVTKHEFYAVHANAGETVASVHDKDLVPWGGVAPLVSLEQLAAMALQHRDSFTVNFDQLPGRPMIHVPQGKFISAILKLIDGERAVGEIVAEIQKDPKYNSPPNEEDIMRDFEDLMLHMNRGHALYLRAKHIKPFTSLKEIGDRKF